MTARLYVKSASVDQERLCVPACEEDPNDCTRHGHVATTRSSTSSNGQRVERPMPDRAPSLTVDLDGLVIGPDQWLILSTRRDVSMVGLHRLRDQIPAALRGRILIVDQMDMAALDVTSDNASLPPTTNAQEG